MKLQKIMKVLAVFFGIVLTLYFVDLMYTSFIELEVIGLLFPVWIIIQIFIWGWISLFPAIILFYFGFKKTM